MVAGLMGCRCGMFAGLPLLLEEMGAVLLRGEAFAALVVETGG